MDGQKRTGISTMTRPTYETQEHLKKEEELAKFAAYKWNCEMRKQDKFNQFDYVAINNGKVRAFVELRCRSNEYNKYPTCFVTANKLSSAFSMHQATGLKILFLVGWSDKIGVANLVKQYPITIGGRFDRNDKADIEALAEIPISDFQIFGEVNEYTYSKV